MSTSSSITTGMPDSLTLSRRIGIVAAALSTVLGVLFLIGVAVNLATSGSVYPSGSDVKAISANIALLWNLVLVVMFAALRREAGTNRAVVSEIALAFAVLLCGASSASWFASITVFPRLAQTFDPGLAALFDPYSPVSLAYSLEHLAWGLFFGIATLLAAVALEPAADTRWLRGTLILTSLLSLAHFVGVVTNGTFLISLGHVSWGVTFPVSTALLAVMFRQRLGRRV